MDTLATTASQSLNDCQSPQATVWWRKPDALPCQSRPPKPGDVCPTCGNGRLAYDGLFILACSACGEAAESGAFT
ncbi:MAG: hypothetical protein IPH82_11030 [Chloroflexi bacterium]|nr:hypothetical protein [Chloroflexota bacterium]